MKKREPKIFQNHPFIKPLEYGLSKEEFTLDEVKEFCGFTDRHLARLKNDSHIFFSIDQSRTKYTLRFEAILGYLQYL